MAPLNPFLYQKQYLWDGASCKRNPQSKQGVEKWPCRCFALQIQKPHPASSQR